MWGLGCWAILRRLRVTVTVADGLLFKKMINCFLIISKAFCQQSVCGWVVVVWHCQRVLYVCAARGCGWGLQDASLGYQ